MTDTEPTLLLFTFIAVLAFICYNQHVFSYCSFINAMDYKLAFYVNYLLQQDLPATDDNIGMCGVDENQLKLLYEDDCTWVILNDGDEQGKWINVIWKDAEKGMETIAL